MSVIIRLQNLPWSANALDIRQFFRGLSIPEGGVHIVGGEMGDAFIAFSTDEDARQAMMHDREAINGVQIRLLLSSRTEMQKVIEMARQQSLLALKKASGGVLTQPKSSPPIAVATNIQSTVVSAVPQPPVITASSFQNILTNTAAAAATPSFLAYQQQAGLTLVPEIKNTAAASSGKISLDSDDSESRHDRERRRSGSRDRRRSRSHSRERSIFRRRRERSRDRSRERDWTNGRRSSRHRSRSRERSHAHSRERSRDRSRERERFRNNNNNREHNRRNSRDSGNINRPRSMDASDVKSKSNLSPWSGTTNAYQASYSSTDAGQQSFMKVANYQATFNSDNKSLGNGNKSIGNITNYNPANQSLTALNNYSLSGILSTGNSNDSFKGFALQNPYTTALNASTNIQGNVPNTASSSSIPGIFVEKKSLETNIPTTAGGVDNATSLTQEPITFANVNPYEQMYPNLFAQAAALTSGQKSVNTKPNSSTMSSDSPKAEETKPKDVDPNETNCIKISNMCSRTTYSDLRKFFVGLFIPHNGIKMLNDKHGLRVGIAYVQFSRQSSVAKALCRSKNLLKGKSLIIEAVAEQEFNEAEDSFRPPNQDKEYGHRGNESDETNDESTGGGGSHGNNNSGFSALNPYKKMIQLEPFTVLYIEDIPSLATEQDIMKMFSSYSLYDILLIASPENRREFVAHVRFSREEDAKSAYEDRAHHQIGYRRVRIRPSTIEEMENAKEKIRLANEQLMKEEQAAEEAEEAKRKLEKLITEHIEKEESKQQNIVSMDLTQEDADDDRQDDEHDDDDDDVIETTNELQNNNNAANDNDNVMKNRENYNQEAENSNNLNLRPNDIYSLQSPTNKFSSNLDPRRPQTPNIPSIFDLNPMNSTNLLQNQNRANLFNDPRLRNMSERTNSAANSIDNNNIKNNPAMGGAANNFNNFNPNFNNQQQMNNVPTTAMNNMHNNFVILKNCEYNTRINDVAQLLLTANLALKHIEPLRNERQLPTGEFIVEFRRTNDAEIAVQRFHNIQFRNRSLRVFPITPQEIADRLGKPFLSYIPGGNGIRITKGMINDSLTRNLNMANNVMNNSSNNNNNNNNRFRGNNNSFNDNGSLNNDDNNGNDNNNNNGRSNNGGNGIPEQFTRPGCVLSLENVPYKAQLSDILNFFQGFDLTPDDIIRRFNDDGSPTGDARVAFMSPEQARAAFESRKRKKLFGRNIFIKTI